LYSWKRRLNWLLDSWRIPLSISFDWPDMLRKSHQVMANASSSRLLRQEGRKKEFIFDQNIDVLFYSKVSICMYFIETSTCLWFRHHSCKLSFISSGKW
jgi:hypothetical protein